MDLPKTINGGINISKIDKKYIITGKNGDKYINLRIVHTPQNQYGQDYMITQDVDKETRDKAKASGEWPDTPILGNAKVWGDKPSPQQQQPVASNNQEDDLPF